VARIRSRYRDNCLLVTVVGALAAADLGRLEHACSPALTEAHAALQLDLRRVTTMDRSARALVNRISSRGARVDYPKESRVDSEVRSSPAAQPPAARVRVTEDF
jgi:hypothetical protein